MTTNRQRQLAAILTIGTVLSVGQPVAADDAGDPEVGSSRVQDTPPLSQPAHERLQAGRDQADLTLRGMPLALLLRPHTPPVYVSRVNSSFRSLGDGISIAQESRKRKQGRPSQRTRRTVRNALLGALVGGGVGFLPEYGGCTNEGGRNCGPGRYTAVGALVGLGIGALVGVTGR